MKASSGLGWLVLAGCAVGCFGGGSYSPVRTAFNRGVHLASAGELEAAITEYREALRVDANDYRARFNLGSTLEDLADRAEAGGDDAKAGEHRREARQQYEWVLQRRPGELRASINLALREYSDGARGQAHERLRTTTEAHPDDPRPWAARARLRLAAGDVEAAEQALRAGLAIEPTDVASNLLLGDLLAQRDGLDEARSAYSAALRRGDDEIAVLFALGQLESQAKRWGEARVWFERILLIDPDHASSRLRLADVLDQLGDQDGAELQRLTVKTRRR